MLCCPRGVRGEYCAGVATSGEDRIKRDENEGGGFEIEQTGVPRGDTPRGATEAQQSQWVGGAWE